MNKTLLQIAGVSKKSINWDNSNLLLIDMQNQYFERELDLKDSGKEAVSKAREVLEFARKRKVNIFHVMHIGSEQSSLFNSTSNDIRIIDELEPMKEECIITKSMPNSFYKTSLYDFLQLTGKKQLVIMGFASHMCVTATTIASFELGFDNFVITDCCATRSLPFFNDVVEADLLHKSSMALLGDRYATLVKSEDILN